MKKILSYSLILSGLAVAAYFLFFSGKKEQHPSPQVRKAPPVDFFVVDYQNLVNEIVVSGSILAYDEVELKNEVAGRITQIHLPEGEFVKKGSLLVKLYDDDLKATLKNLENQLKIKEMLYKRQEELLKVNGIGENEYIENGLAIEVLRSEIEVQQVKIRKTEVRAPFDGYIGLRNVSLGSEITPATVLATIRTNQKLKLDFSVPEKYGSFIKNDMLVKFALTGMDTLFEARVIATEQGIDEATRSLKIRALISSSSEKLLPGAFAKVNLILSENPQSLLVPSRAVIPGERTKKIILARNGKAHFQEVKTGARQTETVEIIDGVAPGDTVITSGLMMLKEGSELKFANPVKTQL